MSIAINSLKYVLFEVAKHAGGDVYPEPISSSNKRMLRQEERFPHKDIRLDFECLLQRPALFWLRNFCAFMRWLGLRDLSFAIAVHNQEQGGCIRRPSGGTRS